MQVIGQMNAEKDLTVVIVRNLIAAAIKNTREETGMAAVNWFLFKDRGTTAKVKRAIAQKYCTRKHCSGRDCRKPKAPRTPSKAHEARR